MPACRACGPLALILGTGLIVVLYLFLNAAYFYVLTPLEVASVGENASVAFEAASRFTGPGAAAFISACLMISAYGTLHTTLLSGPRVPFTMAESHLLPAQFSRLSSRNVPAVAIVMVGLWAIVLTMSCTFDVLTDIYVFVYLLVNTLVVTPGRAIAGVGLVVMGLPVYRYFELRMERVGPTSWIDA